MSSTHDRALSHGHPAQCLQVVIAIPLGKYNSFRIDTNNHWTSQYSTMAAEHGSSSIRATSKRRQGDGGTAMSDASGRFLSPARAREPAAGKPAIGESPTRFTGENMRADAVSPAAPTQDMTITELTHAYQHLAAQLGLDRQWAKRVESVITDHALWLDKHSRAGNTADEPYEFD